MVGGETIVRDVPVPPSLPHPAESPSSAFGHRRITRGPRSKGRDPPPFEETLTRSDGPRERPIARERAEVGPLEEDRRVRRVAARMGRNPSREIRGAAEVISPEEDLRRGEIPFPRSRAHPRVRAGDRSNHVFRPSPGESSRRRDPRAGLGDVRCGEGSPRASSASREVLPESGSRDPRCSSREVRLGDGAQAEWRVFPRTENAMGKLLFEGSYQLELATRGRSTRGDRLRLRARARASAVL